MKVRHHALINPILAASVVVSSAAASAADMVVLQPASKWILNYADDSCALRRTFGPPEQEAVLEIRQFQPGDSVYFTIASKSLRTLFVDKPKVSVDPDLAPLEIDYAIPVRISAGHEGYTFPGSLRAGDPKSQESAAPLTPQDRDARERSIKSVTVAKGFSKPLQLVTGNLHAAMDGMRKCTDELLTHWGIDAEAQRTLSRPVKPLNMENWARKIQADYPSSKLRNMESGIVRVRMTVDPAGAPLSCHIQIKAPDDTFERTACEHLMRYAQFEPALDAQGKPIASYYVTSVIYRVF